MSDLTRPKKIGQLSATVKAFAGRLDRRNLQDAFALTYRRRGSFHLTLSGLGAQANADVLLLNSRKRVMKRSQLGKGLSEAITATLAKGNYWVQVVLKGRQATRYNLKLTTQNTAPVFQSGDRFITATAGTTIPITANQIQFSDTLQAPDQLKYRLNRTPVNGVLLLNNNPIGQGSTFTQADINAGRVKYLKTASNPPILIASTGNPDETGLPTTPLVSGFHVTWYAFGGTDGGTDPEIFLYDGKNVRQITQNSVPDAVFGINGSTLFYASQVGTGGTWEVFTYNDATQTTTRLTNNAVDDIIQGVSNGNVYWSNNSGAGNTTELFVHNHSTGLTRQLTNNDLMDVFGGFDGDKTAWATVQPDNSLTVSYFNGTTGTTTPVTSQASRQDLIVHGSKVGYYQATNNGTPDLFLFDVSNSSTTRLTNNTVQDFLNGITDSDVFLQSAIGANGTIDLFRYNLATGTLVRLTNNDVDDSFAPSSDAFSGANALWRSPVGPQVNGTPTLELFYGNALATAVPFTNNSGDEGRAEFVQTLLAEKIIWSSDIGPIKNGAPTSELFLNGANPLQLTNNSVNDDNFSTSNKAIAWRSAAAVDEIYYFAIGDSFEFTVEDGMGGSSSLQTLEIAFS